MSLPHVLISTVIRGKKEDIHGELHLIDLNSGDFETVYQHNDEIDWSGRGGYRGLRGIAYYNEYIYVATSQGLLLFDRKFNIIERYFNQYVLDCHEIFLYDGLLYLTATKTDSIVIFDPAKESFVEGLCFRRPHFDMGKFIRYDPNKNDGPGLADTLHINTVYVDDTGLYFCGTRLLYLICVEDDDIFFCTTILRGTHNCRPFDNGFLYNDTSHDRVVFRNSEGECETYCVKMFTPDILLPRDLDRRVSRQGFARGLVANDEIIVGGSTPATVSIYRRGVLEPEKVISLSMDVRHTVHGLSFWPYSS